MLRLIEVALRTARLKDARGLPAILLALARLLRPFVILAAPLLWPPGTWPALIDLLLELLSSASR
ncbi:MAG: hypothetical protein HC871_13475 [Rhizobiales bacterium]|nr:hypothetical protein [Hyphomicrobiales bacterium]